MQHTITRVLSYQPYIPRVGAVLGGICAIAIFLYGAFLLLAVMHTAARTSLEKQISATMAELGDLEAVYLAETKKLTPERATDMGFAAPVAVSVVFTAGQNLTRADGALSLYTQ